MKNRKYPIGTLIKYTGHWGNCKDKVGRIVNIIYGVPLIYLPESQHVSIFSTKEIPATVQCGWDEIELAYKKGQQLLFSFMVE